jgi:5-oxoprolinase (ATP-hydrolysing) subunit C
MMEILQPGIISSVQDGGRQGYRNIGVTPCGAMDVAAFQVANLLAGNARNEAAIEIALGGIQIKFHSDTVVALTGANINASLDGKAVPPWWVEPVRAGQVLRSTPGPSGLYAYLAIAGGIEVEKVLGSCSTDLKGGFGGIGAGTLKAGTRIGLPKGGNGAQLLRGFGLNAQKCGLLGKPGEPVRMLPAAEWGDYAPAMQKRFLSAAWRVQADSNRIGYRLAGPVIECQKPRELLSHGILPGVIQLPPSGQPVVQMNDANTCGGYPKLGVVIEADMGRLAQARPGDTLRFEQVDRESALDARREMEACINRAEALIALARQVAERRSA